MSEGRVLKSILLVGPPGAGKSPLGDFLEKQVISGRRMWHFDFGRELRAILSASAIEEAGQVKNFSRAKFFSAAELERIRQSLQTATLFEEKDKRLVCKVLRHYLESKAIDPDDLLILNGLPRHQEQVSWLDGLAEIRLVINLNCSEDTAIRRIQSNRVEERHQREDDLPEVIQHRHRIYRERTQPLVDFFRKLKISIIDLGVSEDTEPAGLWKELLGFSEFRQLLE